MSKLPRPTPHPTSLRLNAFAPLRRFGGGGFYWGCCAYRLFGLAALHSDEKSHDFTFDPRHLHFNGLRSSQVVFFVVYKTIRTIKMVAAEIPAAEIPTAEATVIPDLVMVLMVLIVLIISSYQKNSPRALPVGSVWLY